MGAQAGYPAPMQGGYPVNDTAAMYNQIPIAERQRAVQEESAALNNERTSLKTEAKSLKSEAKSLKKENKALKKEEKLLKKEGKELKKQEKEELKAAQRVLRQEALRKLQAGEPLTPEEQRLITGYDSEEDDEAKLEKKRNKKILKDAKNHEKRRTDIQERLVSIQEKMEKLTLEKARLETELSMMGPTPVNQGLYNSQDAPACGGAEMACSPAQ